MRVVVAVSGGADSVALLRLLAEERSRLGLVLMVAHVHHGIRGSEADADAAFVKALAGQLELAFLQHAADTPALARASGKGLEETARTVRYQWFAELLANKACDAVATAHTLNDQAETVLHRLIRGAWTEGLGGIHPVLAAGAPDSPSGLILRPLLGATRTQIVAWLTAAGQPWREDATNADRTYTRNRIRHSLLPELETYNPNVANQLAQVAALAREDEAYWDAEVARLLPGFLLPGRPVRGGGRASSTLPGEKTLAIEVERLRGQPPALVRRLLRGAAARLGVTLDFDQTARLLALTDPPETPRGTPRAQGQREELTGELRVERTPRELRLVFAARPGPGPAAHRAAPSGEEPAAVAITIPGEGEGFGWRLRCSFSAQTDEQAATATLQATLRAARPGDLVRLRYSRGAPKKVKEVLERIGVPAAERASWPVLEFGGEILWMAGTVLEPGRLLIAAEKRA